MPRMKPEVITGARGERGPSTVQLVPSPEEYPQVREVKLAEEEAHFVSRFREYSVVIITEPDKVDHGGNIVKGRNKAVRFRDFNLITRDPDVIEKIRHGLGRAYGLGAEVWEKWQQDRDLAEKAVAAAEAAIDGLPADMQQALMERLEAKFESFKLRPRTQPGVAVDEDDVEDVPDEEQ